MAERIRIVHVALQLETGGMERLLVEFARHADRARFALQFVALGTRGVVADELESLGCPVTTLNVRPGLRPSILFKLAHFFREHRADIVHTHNTKPLLYAGPAARIAGIPGVIHTRHGQRHGATARQNTLFRMACRCADRIVCVSDNSARLCRAEGIDAAAIHTISNGIDTARFTLAGPVENGPAVFVGRLSPEKDVATLLRATALVLRKRPSFRLHIAGTGSCRAELSAMARTLGLDNCVTFLGEVRDIPPLLSRASLFVLPSLTEGLPLTVLEAMACGLPVVATSVGGTPEAVANGRSGLLVEPAQPEQLADALLRVYVDFELARQMGAAGAQLARDRFDVRTMVTKYETLYHQILPPRKALAA